MRDRLIEKVLKTIRNYSMIRQGDTVIVALSGGPDSVFLLLALAELGKKVGIKKLVAANLDHGLRGKESRADSAFAGKAAAGLGIEFIHKKIDLRKNASRKLSMEEAGREARYAFFRSSAKRCRANVIATGHTLDDQAETLLMRLVRGTSLKGMAGISPAREDGSLRIIRPLIELEKREIVKYLDGSGVSYRIDSTNLEPVYFRNVVRSEIIPFLEKYNPKLKRALFSLAEHLREDLEYISKEKRSRANLIRSAGDGLEVELKDIVVQPRALQKEVMRDCLEKAGGVIKKLSFRHWKELEGLIARKGKGKSVDLPGGIRVKRTERALFFAKT